MTTFISDRSLKWRRGLRGLGQACDITDPTCGGITTDPGAWNFPTSTTDTSTTGGTGINWNQLLQNLTNAGTQIGKTFTSYANPIYNLAPGTYYQQTPYGTVVSTGGVNPAANPFASLTSSSMMPLLLLGGGALLLVMMAKK